MATRFKIFVRNLPWTISHVELQGFFAQFGKVKKALVLFDKNNSTHTSFGTVEYFDQASVARACTKTLELEGNTLRVLPTSWQQRNTETGEKE